MAAGNPFDDLESWAVPKIGGTPIPGAVQREGTVMPRRKILWLVQQGIGMGFGSTVWRGPQIIEGIIITFVVSTGEEHRTAVALLQRLVPDRKKRGVAMDILWGPANAQGVAKVVLTEFGVPLPPDAKPALWVFVFTEFVKPVPITPAKANEAIVNASVPQPETPEEKLVAAKRAQAFGGPTVATP